jgi:predicted cobalt transporter CbtA
MRARAAFGLAWGVAAGVAVLAAVAALGMTPRTAAVPAAPALLVPERAA